MTTLNANNFSDNICPEFSNDLLSRNTLSEVDVTAPPVEILGITGEDLFKDQCALADCDPYRVKSPYRRAREQEVNTSYGLRRLREKLLGPTSDGASSEDVLTLLLCNSLEERQAREIAISLLGRFISLRAILAASDVDLIETCGGNEECVSLVKGYYLLMKTALREPVEVRHILKDKQALYDYLRISLAHEENEVFRVLLLNTKYILIKDELMSRGTINHVSVYPREVVKRVLEVGAHSVILVHNHPSGDHRPSREDIAMTIRLQRVLTDIDVVLLDHVIVARHRCESMQSLGLIQERV